VNKTVTELVDPKLYLLQERVQSIAFLLGIMALLLCCGLWYGDLAHYHVTTMLNTMSLYTWTVLLLGYAALKIYTKTHAIANLINSTFGLWLWMYLFLMFVVLDQQPASPLEAMLLLPILLESWELVLNIANLKLAKHWEKNHGK
jgi:hypothetical protein